jgi:hypothetical protein
MPIIIFHFRLRTERTDHHYGKICIDDLPIDSNVHDEIEPYVLLIINQYNDRYHLPRITEDDIQVGVTSVYGDSRYQNEDEDIFDIFIRISPLSKKLNMFRYFRDFFTELEEDTLTETTELYSEPDDTNLYETMEESVDL